ncbi:ABC transporter substrate-binding protein [Nocardia inohanensis]|uniref:ABC transporter substrate-binding protein n=1 Tax=Nocardia inohanensis TaxID=209246 RepID=UPI001FE07FD4|nr:ABC transporter substrate-binding protein [Nocardia inohanensis]
MNRRQLFKAGLGLSAILTLAACGDGSPGDSGGAPRRGGTLRIGAIGKSAKVERDPHATLSNDSDFLIMSLVYDPLTVPGADPNVAPRLASKWESDAAQRVWTFTIADGAAFHDGRPVTAEDVVWSLRRLRETAGETKVPVASADDIKAAGPNAVTLTCANPNSQLPLLLRLMTFTVPRGTTDFTRAVGSGPFQLESYHNGNARLIRNDAWHGGAPLLDAIEVTLFESPESMANAVLARQIDLASSVGAVAGRTAEGRGDLQVVRRPDDVAVVIAMRTCDGPFADARVRTALRLAVDREAMVAQVLSGYGSIANDVLGTADPTYDKSLAQRTRDVAKAKQLLAAAKFDTGKTYQLLTKQEAPGEVESAKVFASQVEDIGVSIEVVVQDSNAFYDQTWLKAPLYTANWGTNDSVVFFASKVMYSRTKWNETGFQDPDFDKAYLDALAAPAGAKFTEASRTIQQIQYDHGGYLVWGLADGIDVASSSVRDLPKLGGYGRVQLERVWMSN